MDSTKTNFIEGKIEKGHLKGSHFEIVFGEKPFETQIFIDGKKSDIMLQSLQVTVSVSEPYGKILLESIMFGNKSQ